MEKKEKQTDSRMAIFEALRQVPAERTKTISAGKLKGMTDISPMWRIEKLTELFGPAGIGWYTEVIERWVDCIGDQHAVNIRIHLYIKQDGEWSKPIEGIGGAMLFGKGVGAGTISDEAAKMAYTDAISVACKALGMAADIYYGSGDNRTKYSGNSGESDDVVKQYAARIEAAATAEELTAIWQECRQSQPTEIQKIIYRICSARAEVIKK